MAAVPETSEKTDIGKHYITLQEYLDLERKADTKSEYHNGVLVAMAGATWAHSLITSNIATRLNLQMEATPCRAVTQDMKVWVEACRKFYYPDVLVVCGEPEFHDEHRDYLTNPTLIIEVLSDSTAATDRSEKFFCYQTLASLTTYVLVEQNSPRIECFVRQDDGSWRYTLTQGLEAMLSLDAIGCTLRFADIYARVPFPASENPAAPDVSI